MRTENGIIVFGRAFKLLEKAYVELRSLEGNMGVLRRANWWLRKGTCGLKRIHSDG